MSTNDPSISGVLPAALNEPLFEPPSFTRDPFRKVKVHLPVLPVAPCRLLRPLFDHVDGNRFLNAVEGNACNLENPVNTMLSGNGLRMQRRHQKSAGQTQQ